MRPEPNNEIDLLLRQLSRQNGVPVFETDEQHLDADELNSYVANALPVKTRARYTEHLADCSSCRKMVAQLSAAEGMVPVQQPVAVVGPSGFKSFLASFFSPMVLRYAVPALGVIVIAVVGIVMLRQERAQRGAASVAQVTNADQNRAVPESPSAPTEPTSTPVPAQNKQVPRAGVIADAPAPAAEAPPPKAASAEEAKRQPDPEKKTAPVAEQNASARDAQPVDSVSKVDDAAKKDKQQEVIATAPATIATPGSTAPEPQRAKTGEAAGTGGVGSVANAPKSRQDFQRSRKEEINALSSSAETRTVAGREFRKQGNVWIDAAYNSYQSTTIVTRGTEQYRALIADEPEIHTIAENLKGEFVVVWKGRAYRVR